MFIARSSYCAHRATCQLHQRGVSSQTHAGYGGSSTFVVSAAHSCRPVPQWRYSRHNATTQSQHARCVDEGRASLDQLRKWVERPRLRITSSLSWRGEIFERDVLLYMSSLSDGGLIYIWIVYVSRGHIASNGWSQALLTSPLHPLLKALAALR